MSWVETLAAHCDKCGHEWLPKGTPERCAKCKNRAWNSNPAIRAAPAQERVVQFEQDYKPAFDPRSIPGVSVGLKECKIDYSDF